MRFRFNLIRSAAAFIAASLLVLSTSVLAFAADAPVTVLGLKRGYVANVVVPDAGSGAPRPMRAGLIVLRAGGGLLFDGYCVDIDQPVAENQGVTDAEWGKHPNPHSEFAVNAGKIAWVVAHSYPSVSLAALKSASKVNRDIAEWQAAAATQLAVWRLSNGVGLDTETRKVSLAQGTTSQKEDVEKIYQFLLDTVQDSPQPAAALHMDSSKAGRTSTGLVGPITVSTTATPAALTAQPPAVGVTDVDGKPLNEVATGRHAVYLKVPDSAGHATLTANGVAVFQPGQLLVGVSPDHPTQPMVVATSTDIPLTRTTEAEWKATVPSATSTTPPSSGETTSPTRPHASAAAPVTADGTSPSVTTGGTGTIPSGRLLWLMWCAWVARRTGASSWGNGHQLLSVAHAFTWSLAVGVNTFGCPFKVMAGLV